MAGLGVNLGRFPGANELGWSGSSQDWEPLGETTKPRPLATGAPPADLWPAVRNITCPTLVVRGAETDTLSAEMAKEMEDTLAQGKLVQVDRAGHMVFEDNPEDFIAEVTLFLR